MKKTITFLVITLFCMLCSCITVMPAYDDVYYSSSNNDYNSGTQVNNNEQQELTVVNYSIVHTYNIWDPWYYNPYSHGGFYWNSGYNQAYWSYYGYMNYGWYSYPYHPYYSYNYYGGWGNNFGHTHCNNEWYGHRNRQQHTSKQFVNSHANPLPQHVANNPRPRPIYSDNSKPKPIYAESTSPKPVYVNNPKPKSNYTIPKENHNPVPRPYHNVQPHSVPRPSQSHGSFSTPRPAGGLKR